MKSIYSLEILQRILDKWGIGKIESVTYYNFNGRGIWWHIIETNQGEFELYSYPDGKAESSHQKLALFFQDRHGRTLDTICHSFDRYHVLRMRSSKHLVTIKQIATDLNLLIGQPITKIFRVYGSILDIELFRETIISCYGSWSIQETENGKQKVLCNFCSSKEKIDTFLTKFESKHLKFERYLIKGNWFEIFFSDNFSIHFYPYGGFAAAEINISQRKNRIKIFAKDQIYYSKGVK